MGLDTTHDCWHGAYSSFSTFRKKIAQVAGYGKLKEYQGYGGTRPWPDNNDVLQILLTHSDCEGEIKWQDCAALADRMTELLPALKIASEGHDHLFSGGGYEGAAKRFIAGLRLAAAQQEDVEFH